MKLRQLAACLALSIFALACGGAAPGEGSPDPTDPGRAEGPVFVDSTEILDPTSFPGEVRLIVRGSLPTPCHDVDQKVENRGSAIDVRVWSTSDPSESCAQVLEPFEISIPLGSVASADVVIRLNGQAIVRSTPGSPSVSATAPATGAVSLVGAGWSFGMCGGYCAADLAVDGATLVLTGRSNMSAEPLYVNRGALTAAGRDRIERAVERLRGVALEPVYGCPDCADGGAAYLVLARQGTTSRHEMEFGRPPAELAELDRLATTMIGALEACTRTELVVPAPDCRLWEGR